MSWDFPSAADANASQWEAKEFDTYGAEATNEGENYENQGFVKKLTH